MPYELSFSLQPQIRSSEYIWLNIERNGERIGKVRGKIDNDVMFICSIMIFPEFQGKNYGSHVIKKFKEHYNTIVADRVRPSAVLFWERMGFLDNGDGSYIFINPVSN